MDSKFTSSQSTFFYVYILQSVASPERFYTGFTEHPVERLREHNQGKSVHTRSHRPWKLKTCIAFSDRDRALAFERYLKSSSGRAFARKRL